MTVRIELACVTMKGTKPAGAVYTGDDEPQLIAAGKAVKLDTEPIEHIEPDEVKYTSPSGVEVAAEEKPKPKQKQKKNTRRGKRAK